MDAELLEEKDFLESIQTLRNAVEAKDKYTLGHLDRVSDLAVLIGKKMGLSEVELRKLKIGGLVHDVGKVSIEDNILFKNSKLSDEEYLKIKQHPGIGAEMLKNQELFQNIIPIVKYHHERYDGKGYPEKLAGEQIPLLARVTAVADAFDAMSSKRTYNSLMDVETIKQEFRVNKGTQFDPVATDAFLEILENNIDDVKKIQNKY